MWSYQSYDEERIDSGRTSSGRNRLLIFIYIYLYLDFFLPYLRHKLDVIASCNFLNSLLQCIGQNFCMNYIQIVVFLLY